MHSQAAETTSARAGAAGLRPLLEIGLGHEPLAELAREVAAATGPVEARASASIRPFLLAALLEAEPGLAGRPGLIVAADDRGARDLARELGAYLAPRRVRYYPSRGPSYESGVAAPAHLVGLRIAALDDLTGGPEADVGEAGPPVVVASAVALREAVPDASLRPHGFSVHRGEEVDLTDVGELLVDCGYERVDQVTDRGQFAIRGGILDVYPATEDRAARLELFGDEIESIRHFSTFTQRSLGESDRVELAPAAELAPAYVEQPPIERFGAPLELLPGDVAVIVAEAEEIEPALRDHAQDVLAASGEADLAGLYVDVDEALARRAVLRVLGGGEDFRAQLPTSSARSVAEAEGELDRELRSGYRTVVCFEHRGEAERLRYQLQRHDPEIGLERVPAEGGLAFCEARIRDGFVAPSLRLAVIPFRRLLHRRAVAEPAAPRGRLASFAELRVGDVVVHADHGIARFAGFETKTVGGVTRDYLELEYRGSDRVFTPTEQLDKISRYIGAGGAEPELSALGSKRWEGIKARARRAARELAGDLLNLYAERQARRGHAFPPDDEWDLAFAESFGYRETADQLDAIEAVRADMESERPMDRLICGDVGYGKTEVALRAAHKAAVAGRQVMMLVPTTILAQQHLGTFIERLADSPLEVEMVSRLRRPSEVRDALRRFSEGSVDVLIGTHRMLSRDVRARDLGLVIVDEEQRFGVKQKELMRQLRLRVDVLSLSATPIPRTLQMSLAGLRDISVIETPPEGRRPVRTYVGPWDEELVRRAIEREAERGGQTFFLHNRVETLHETAERLRGTCPQVRFAEAHGQMDERELESTMLGFLRGDVDCLVATTIIESGLDIPAANTLIVERADQLGLAQAYQIRGRVGRSRERAYAYLLYPSREALTREAGARLATLSDHTELGSGFAIAMRDLELRGAGDLLGDEQSGHVAAVGFELYMQLLSDAVEALQRGDAGGEAEERPSVRFDLPLDAYLPADYIPFEAAKIDVHRRIAAARETSELRALADELCDRFGPPPRPVTSLLELQRARIELAEEGAGAVEYRGGRLSVSPLELDSAAVKRLRERIPEAAYEYRARTLALRVADDPEARLAAVLELAAALREATRKIAAAM